MLDNYKLFNINAYCENPNDYDNYIRISNIVVLDTSKDMHLQIIDYYCNDYVVIDYNINAIIIPGFNIILEKSE